MTAMNRAFSNLTLAGKILLPLLFLVLVVGPIVTVLLGVFIGPWLLSILLAPTSTSSGSWSPSRRSCCSASRPRS